MIKKFILTGIFGGLMSLFAAGSANIGINDDTLKLKGSFSAVTENQANILVHGEYLDSNLDKFEMGIRTVQSQSFNNYELNPYMGIKVVILDNNNKNVAVPLVIGADIDVNDYINTEVGISYSPKILSFDNLESYYDLFAAINYKLIDNGYLQLSYNKFSFEYESDLYLKQDNLLVGYKILF